MNGWWWLLFSHKNRLAADGDGGGDGPVGGTEFPVLAVHFDGDTAMAVSDAGGIFGGANGDKWTYSAWVRTYNASGGNDTPAMMTRGAGPLNTTGIFVYSTAADSYRIAAGGAFSTYSMAGNPSPIDHDWQHLLVSHDEGAARFQVYLNDVLQTLSSAYGGPDAASAVHQSFNVGGRVSGTSGWIAGAFWHGEMAELWVDYTTAIDFSVTANRRLFIDASLDPADVGTSGETPLGTPPQAYYSVRPLGTATDFLINRGTAEAFNRSLGLLTLASTTPSD